MHIPLDRQNRLPLYEQIKNHLRQNILAGTLAPGTRLPSTRQLAETLTVSRITVKNAYADLESDGLVSSREGSGTYVMPPVLQPSLAINEASTEWPLWQQNFHQVNETSPAGYPVVPSRSAGRPELISFTGVGDPRQFPVKDFYKAIQTVIRRDGVEALGYGDFGGGYPPLRKTISYILASQGIQANQDNILITSGSQQALGLVCSVLLKPGDVVLVESPTYNFALELFRSLNLKMAGVPVDERGMQVEMLEVYLQQQHPRLIYTIPNFQNPTGACMSGTRRRQLIALADRYNIPILEDDFVGDLRYDGRAQPAIKALDPGGRVIYTGTFSKMLMPGLRVGYMVADGPVFQKLLDYKRVNDLTTSNLIQRTIDVYVTVGRYQAHLRRSCQVYRKRRDAMLAAIKCYLPGGVRVFPPHGGLFVWLRLPDQLSALDLLPVAMDKGIEFTPGNRFFADPKHGERYLRLNFATQTPEDIQLGVQRLGAALQAIS